MILILQGLSAQLQQQRRNGRSASTWQRSTSVLTKSLSKPPSGFGCARPPDNDANILAAGIAYSNALNAAAITMNSVTWYCLPVVSARGSARRKARNSAYRRGS